MSNADTFRRLVEYAKEHNYKFGRYHALRKDACMRFEAFLKINHQALAEIDLRGRDFAATLGLGTLQFTFVKRDGMIRIMDHEYEIMVELMLNDFVPLFPVRKYESFSHLPAEIRYKVLKYVAKYEEGRIITITEVRYLAIQLVQTC